VTQIFTHSEKVGEGFSLIVTVRENLEKFRRKARKHGESSEKKRKV